MGSPFVGSEIFSSWKQNVVNKTREINLEGEGRINRLHCLSYILLLQNHVSSPDTRKDSMDIFRNILVLLMH